MAAACGWQIGRIWDQLDRLSLSLFMESQGLSRSMGLCHVVCPGGGLQVSTNTNVEAVRASEGIASPLPHSVVKTSHWTSPDSTG